MKRLSAATTPILMGALLAGAPGVSISPVSAQASGDPLGAEASSTRPAARDVAARTAPAVVRIRALAAGAEVSSGSGFIIRSDGVVVTNFHVIEAGRSVEVELATGEVFTDVYVLGTDERRDLAVLKLPTARLPAVEIGDAGALAVGDRIYVMGNPLGLDRTFSDGLVSAHRVLDGVRYLQISAPISPGSSGGPVLDTGGRVVGVATGSMAEGQNLNLAVPMSYAEGLLGVAGVPEPFERVAARWLEDDDVSELEPWEAIVVRQLQSAGSRLAEEGYSPYEMPRYELLAPDSVETALTDLPAGDYRALAVCDQDCSDLDLMVTDQTGEVLGLDVLEDDVPIVDFRTGGGRVGLAIKMIRCTTDVCYTGLQLFRRP